MKRNLALASGVPPKRSAKAKPSPLPPPPGDTGPDAPARRGEIVGGLGPNGVRRRVSSLRALGLEPALTDVGLLYAALTEAVVTGGRAEARDALDAYIRASGVSDGGASARVGLETMRRKLADAIPLGDAMARPGFEALSYRRLVDRVAVEGWSLSAVVVGHCASPNGRTKTEVKAALEHGLQAMADRAGVILRLLG